MELTITEQFVNQRLKKLRLARNGTLLLHLFSLPLLVALVALLFYLARAMPPFGTEPAHTVFPLLLGDYLLSTLALFMAIGIHELGHLIGAWWANYYVAMIMVGPFAWVKTAKGIRLRLIQNNLLQMSGVVLTGPLDRTHLRWRYFGVVLGGPLASLIWLLFLLMLRSWFSLPMGFNWYHIGLDIFILIAFFTCLFALLPVKQGVAYSDALQLFYLMRNNSVFLQNLHLTSLSLQVLVGTSPYTLLKAALTEFSDFPKTGNISSGAALLLFDRAIESEDFNAAKTYLDLALAGSSQPVAPRLLLAAAYYHAKIAHDPIQARHWLAMCSFHLAHTILLPSIETMLLYVELRQRYQHVEALILLAEGDAVAAHRAATASLKLLDDSIELGLFDWQKSQLTALQQQSTLFFSMQEVTHIENKIRTRQVRRSPMLRHLFGTIAALSLSTFTLAIVCLLITSWNLNLMRYELLAVHHIDRSDYEAAVTDYTQAITAMPTRWLTYWRRANVYQKLEDLPHAIDDFTQAITLSTKPQANLYLQRGSTYYRIADHKAGNKDLQQVLRLSANTPNAEEWSAAVRKVYTGAGINAYK